MKDSNMIFFYDFFLEPLVPIPEGSRLENNEKVLKFPKKLMCNLHTAGPHIEPSTFFHHWMLWQSIGQLDLRSKGIWKIKEKD